MCHALSRTEFFNVYRSTGACKSRKLSLRCWWCMPWGLRYETCASPSAPVSARTRRSKMVLEHASRILIDRNTLSDWLLFRSRNHLQTDFRIWICTVYQSARRASMTHSPISERIKTREDVAFHKFQFFVRRTWITAQCYHIDALTMPSH